jgi:Immunoglobulin domain
MKDVICLHKFNCFKNQTGLELLEWLRLDGNLIESLPASSLSFLRSLRGLDLHHNPWHCTCALRPIRTWLATRNMPFSIPPLCLLPTRLRGQSWNWIDSDELACPPVVGVRDQLVQVQSGKAATLSCQVNANPEASVAWFYSDRLIANLSVSSDTATSTDASVNTERFQQLYFISETGTENNTSHPKLLPAREQESGVYVCGAWNKGGRLSGNVTLLVRSNNPIYPHGFTHLRRKRIDSRPSVGRIRDLSSRIVGLLLLLHETGPIAGQCLPQSIGGGVVGFQFDGRRPISEV